MRKTITPPSANKSEKPGLSLRWHLVQLVVGALLPIALFAVVIIYQLSNQEKAASERRAQSAARSLANTVEREVASTARALQVLAASDPLYQGDLAAFYVEAERVLLTQPSWLTVSLLELDGRQVMNVQQPFGVPLPPVRDPVSLRRVLETRQPSVGNLAVDPESQQMAFPVRIPVMKNGELLYVLTARITSEALATIVESQDPIDGEWTRTVVDGQGIVVSRTRNPDRFVGQRGTPSFLRQIGRAPEGIYRDRTLEGQPVYVAFSRMTGTDWTVAVTVPVSVIQAPIWRAMGFVMAAGLVVVLISGAEIILLSRRISKSITSAAAAAEALAKGQPPQMPPSSIREVQALGQSLEFSAQLLAQRERERMEHLARAEAAREEAEAANRIKDEFLAVLSHELRSPLNPILGWAKLLQSQKLDAEKTAYALETIERNAKLQTQLIEDLLDISRILQGKLLLNMAAVDLVETLEASLETVRLAAEAKNIHLNTLLDPTVPPVRGDAARLQQVMWNLLSNAIKFTPVGGWVDVHLRRIDSDAEILVKDNGKGISPVFLPHIFEYFRQEDGTTTRKFGGLGLGLAIVHHLIDLHGGTIQADSPGEGQGAVFTVRLPLMLEETAFSQDTKAQALVAGADLAGRQILVVDDEPDIRDIVSFTLTQAGATVRVAVSAAEALRELDQAVPDSLVCDIGMPDMDGYTLIRQIRARPPEQGGAIPAIALTAFASEADQQRALAAGFQRHMSKPVEPQVLVQAIADLSRSASDRPGANEEVS